LTTGHGLAILGIYSFLRKSFYPSYQIIAYPSWSGKAWADRVASDFSEENNGVSFQEGELRRPQDERAVVWERKRDPALCQERGDNTDLGQTN
jgi:hypothetical protein